MRSSGTVLLQKRLSDGFRRIALIGVAQEKRLAHGVVTDHGLKMSAGGFDGCQSKWHAAINQCDRSCPRKCKFPNHPPIFFSPAPLLVRRRAVVAYCLSQSQVVGAHLPKSADRGDRGGGTGLIVLAHEVDRQL